MRKLYLLSTLVLLAMFFGSASYSQDFSNKGKDFWVAYGYHQVMNNGNAQDMRLYFASEQNANVTVSIPGLGYTANYFVPANSTVASNPIPKTSPDARLTTGSNAPEDKGINITSDKPIVAYAHIYNQSVSGATILYPTPTLGREYYSINYDNISNTTNANCWFYVVAVDTGTTKVEITPSATTTNGWVPGNTYVVTMTKGQVFNVMGTTNGNSGVDLTGSLIKAIDGSGNGCKKIAVFSGSGRIAISCNGSAPSSDNYMVQSMPQAAWGKKYLTTPAVDYGVFNGDTFSPSVISFYRVCVSDPTTVVKINGAVTGLPLINNFYYQIPATTAPQLIEADKPITVAQYLPSQSACGASANEGDPETIYLSPIEQSISKVLWLSCAQFNINQQKHYINVVLPNAGTAISSFKLDGVTVPASNFVVHPQDPAYSYTILNVTSQPGGGANVGLPHSIQSDSGFNAIAYGYGSFESYGYNAGTNVKDLYQQIRVNTQYGIEQSPSVCSGSPFKFKVSLPYCADSIQWDLSNLPGPPVPTFPKFIYTTCTPGPGGPDSTSVVNGRTIYWYSLPSTYNFLPIGTYPVTITVYAPNNGGCGNVQDIDFDLEVTPPPVPDFTFSTVSCYSEPVPFMETTPQTPKPTYSFWWNFGDPASGAANTSNIRNPTHLFSGPGTYTVRYAAITTPGCLTDTVVHQVTIPDLPNATISGTTSVCVNAASPNVTLTGTGGTGTFTFYYHINAGPAVSVSGGSPITIPVSTATPGTYVYTLDSVRIQGSTLCVRYLTGQSATVTVTPGHTISLTSGSSTQSVCVNTAITTINYTLGNGATGATVTGLPAGVTFAVVGNTLTISGSPTTSAGSPFNFTINTTGNSCTPATDNGTITVNSDHTLSLASGSATQSTCINTAITAITYTIGGGATGVNITGLPPGVTFVVAGNTVTISGSPTSTAGSPYNFTINTTGNACLTAPPLNGTITVTPNHSVSLTGGTATQTVCVNNAITNIVYTLGGGATGATVTGLPAGVTFAVVGNTLTISGSPTTSAGSPFNFTINTTGNACTAATANGTLTVNADHALSLASGSATQSTCINTAITAITYTIGGGATGVNITGLPPGVTFVVAGNTVTISGSPTSTAGSPYNFTINTTGNGCLTAPPLNGTITVTPNHSVSLTGGTATQTVCVNNAITNIVYTLGGGATGATVTGLPAGVTFAVVGNTLTISGSPTTSAGSPFNFTINTTGNACTAATANGTLTVNADHTLSLASGSATQSTCINTAITAITYTIGGGATGVNITGLPPGVTFVVAGNTVTISGSPTSTAGSPYNFTINTTGNGCLTAPPLNGTITVTPNHSVSLTGGTATQTVCVNNAITNIVYTLGGGATGATVTGLPAGVTFAVVGNTLTISGSPTTSAGSPFNFTINTTGNACTAATANGTLTVNADHTLSLASGSATQSTCINTAITAITYTIGGGATGVNITGLPPGVTFVVAGNTVTISGSPTSTAGSPYNFTINTTGNACLTAPPLNGTITVNPDHTVALTSGTASQTLCVNNAITNIVYTLGGGATGATVTGLPAGVTFAVVGNTLTISGSPTTSTGSPFNFTINTTGNSCLVASVNGTLTVNPDHAINLSSPGSTASQTVCINNAITNITYTLSGGATGATVTGLPAGVTGSVAGNVLTISGTPSTTVGSPFNYTITTTGNSCVTATANGTITVTPAQNIALTSAASTDNQAVCINNAIINITYSLSGGATNATVTGLPPGVTSSVAGNVLTITGSPTTTSGSPFNYSISTSGNSCVPATTNGTIVVNPDHAINLTSAASTTNQTICTTKPITAITYTLGGGATGATVTGLPPGVSSTVSGTTVTINGSPTSIAGSPFNYSITTTGNGCVTAAAAGTITVLQTPAITFNPVSGICADVPAFQVNASPAAGTFSGTGITSGGMFTPATAGPGDHTITYTFTAANGCSNSQTQIISVYPLPVVNAGPDRAVIEGGQITLTPTPITGMVVTYLWTPSTYLNNPNISNPVVSNIIADITYTLLVTTDNGCSGTDQVFVKLLKKVAIPNIFSPNGDGVHDKWVIDYLDSYPGCTVDIYNRYGQQIWHSEGYATPWDGTIKGKPVPVGTYYYIVNPKNGRPIMSGYVDVIR